MHHAVTLGNPSGYPAWRGLRHVGQRHARAFINGRAADFSSRADVWFDSGGTACAGSFYRPQGVGAAVACVVMAHGAAGTKDLGLSAYAEGFVGAGLAVLLFDYRHFGASGGQPRQLIDIARQLDDYRFAVRFARTCEGVDPTRIALYGTSLSGGHVLAVAASDPLIAAVVSRVPFAGVEFGRASPRSRVATLRLVAAAAWDSLRGLLARVAPRSCRGV